MEPVGYLLSMSAELTLKTVLIEFGYKNKKIMDIGYDIGKLLKFSVEEGFCVSINEAKIIVQMRAAHLEHFFRYGPKNWHEGAYAIMLFDQSRALDIVAQLIDRISKDPNLLRKDIGPDAIQTFPHNTLAPTSISVTNLILLLHATGEEAARIEKYGRPHR